MWEIWANSLLPKALKRCPKCKKSPNLVKLGVPSTYTERGDVHLLMFCQAMTYFCYHHLQCEGRWRTNYLRIGLTMISSRMMTKCWNKSKLFFRSCLNSFFASKYHSKKSSIKFGQHLKEKLSPKPFANILIWSHWLLGTLHSHGIITTYNVAHRASWISHTPFQGHQKDLFTAFLSNNMSLYRS